LISQIAQQAVTLTITQGRTYAANGAVQDPAMPPWVSDLTVRVFRSPEGVIYVDIEGPRARLASICGEWDLLQGAAHLPGDKDYCSDEAPG